MADRFPFREINRIVRIRQAAEDEENLKTYQQEELDNIL